MVFYDYDEIAAKRFEQILETLKDKNKDSLRTMFSQKALEDSKDIDEDIDYLFSFFQGEIVSWKQDNGSPIINQSFDYGNRMSEMQSFFTIDTDVQKYIVVIFEYTEDTANPGNVGLYTLRVIKAENKDEETQFGYWLDIENPGIYCPGMRSAN